MNIHIDFKPCTSRTGRNTRYGTQQIVRQDAKRGDFSGCLDAPDFLPTGAVLNNYYTLADGRELVGPNTLTLRSGTIV